MLAAGLGEQPAHGQAGVAGAQDDSVDAVHDDPVTTSTTTGVGLVSASYTADRRRDCSTILRSVSSSASPLMWSDLDLLVPVAHRAVRKAQDAKQVDVALDGRGDLGQLHAAGGGDVGDPGGQAGGERGQQHLGRRGGVVLAYQHLRVVGVHDGGLLVLHLLAGAEVAVHGRSAVRAGQPGVAGPELERGDLGLALDGVQGGEQGRDVDAVQVGVGGESHDSSRFAAGEPAGVVGAADAA